MSIICSKILSLLALLVLLTEIANAQSITVRQTNTLSSSDLSYFLPADVDGDGNQDLIVCYYGETPTHQSGFYWYNGLQLGKGIRTGQKISDSHYKPLAAADFNRDGKMDLLTSGGLFENITTQSASWPKGIGGAHDDVAVPADLNNDGWIDIVSTFPGPIWYENRKSADTSFTLHKIPCNIEVISRMQVADMNGDGNLDIILDGNSEIPGTLKRKYAMSILWNQGGNPPVFTEECLTSSTTITRPVYDVGDFNKDGNLDILTRQDDGIGLDWLENDGARPPKFVRHQLIDSGGSDAKFCDLDGDGDLDLVSQHGFDYWENKGGKPPIFQYHALASFDKTRTFIQGAIVHLFDKNRWQFVVGHYNPISYYHESEIDIFDTIVPPRSGVSGKHWALYH